MSYLVFARKWRPQTFAELVGQEHVSQTLSNAISSNRVAHAFLFTGVRGVGKTTAARILAKALNCEQGLTPTPCNTCTNCREITAGNSVDVLEIDGASNTGVDDVREIIENVRYQPAKSRFKIYIIDEVHMLSTSAFNALLKTLEEPPPHVKFIFATTDPHKVPHTIHSRCQRYDFKRISFRLIADRLAEIARSETIEVSDRALFLIAREGEGSMRDAQSLFDQVIAFAGKTVRDEDVVTALGLADRKVLYAVGDAIVSRDPARALELLNDLHLYGSDMRRFARELLEHFRNLAVVRLVPAGDLLPDIPDEERTEISRQAQQMDSADLDRCFRLLMATEVEVARAPFPRLVMEMALIKLATLTPVLAAEEIIERLDELQRRLDGAAIGGSATGSAGAGARTTSAAAARASASAPPDSASTAPRRAPSEHPPAAASGPGNPAGGSTAVGSAAVGSAASGHSWDAFLGFVGKQKVSLATYLRACAAPAIDGTVLGLCVPAGHYHDYLAQREHTQLVEDLAQQFFGRPLRVTVQAASAGETSTSEPTENTADLHSAALGDPVVRAAVEIFGGEVQEVKPRTRRTRGTE